MRRNMAVRIAIPVLSLIILILIGVIVIILHQKGDIRQEETDNISEIYSETEYTEYAEKWQEGIVTYNGSKYRYNTAIKSYLLMGIDKDEKVTVQEGAGAGGGRSDAMFLLVTNAKEKTLSVISIHRNTMTRVEVYSEEGKRLGNYTLQICLQHAYGDGGRVSCNRSVDAVSYLFENLPISGYMALNMAGIPSMNDAVGGVELSVMEDLSDTSLGVDLKKGETVTLSGSDAYVYLRSRDTDKFDSASDRLRRQEQYLIEYFNQLKNTINGDVEKAAEVYQTMEDYLVTNLNAEQMIQELIGYNLTSEQMYTVPGETVMGDTLEEYHVDKDSLQEMIMDLFYEEVEEEQ